MERDLVGVGKPSTAVGSRNVLVTGATGKVGGEAARVMMAAGLVPRLYIRDQGKAAAMRKAGYDVVIGSYETPLALQAACEGIDTVLLVPADANVSAANSVVDAAMQAGVRRIVRISAQGSFSHSPSALLRDHAAGEAKLEASGTQFHHLRCNTFFQNISAFFDWIENCNTIFACRGEQPVSWIDARDIGAAAAAAIMRETTESSAHNLNGPEPMSTFDVADRVSERLGRPISCTSFEADSFIDAAVRNGWSHDLATEWAAMFADDYWGRGLGGGRDTDLRSLIGREPRSFRDFLCEVDFSSAAEMPL